MKKALKLAARRADVVSGLIAIIAWLVINGVWHPAWLPSLASVLRQFADLITSGSLSVLGATAVTLAIGLLVTFVAAAVIASAMAANEIVEQSLLPFVNGFLAVPHIALIPMFAFIWGNGELTRIVATVAFALSPVILTWTTALKSTPASLNEMASAFAAGPAARVRWVKIPAAAAPLIAGVRIGVVQGIKGVVSAEVIIGVVGVGKLVTTASHTFDIPQLYAVVLLIIVVSIVAYVLLTAIENRMTRWTS